MIGNYLKNLLMRLKVVSCIIFGVFIFFLSSSFTYAQGSLSLGMTPTTEKLTLKEGEEFLGKIVLWNLSNKSTNYQIVVRGFRQIENQPGTSMILTEQEEQNSPYSASSWVTVEKESLTLVPNKNQEIFYKINVPKENVAKGEYNVIISFVSESDITKESTATFTTLSSGLPILIKIGDNLREEAELLNFYTEQEWYEYPNVTFGTELKNSGETHITPTGEIIVKNIFDKEVARLKFNDNSHSLLRGNSAEYITNWKDSLLTENKDIAFGPMKASLVSTYRSFQPGFAPLLAETSFWIVPWKYILGLLLLIVVIVITITEIRKKRKKKNQEGR